MSEDHIRYDILTQDALRGVVRKVLAEVAKTGLPGEHHFYVSFDTNAPGVRISSRLLAEYPEEMTIVIQHQFWDLKVNDHSFEIGLSFGGVPEKLLVPFNALKGFMDPAVQFGLQFEAPAAAGASGEAGDTAERPPVEVVTDRAPAPAPVAIDEAPPAEEAEAPVEATEPAEGDGEAADDDAPRQAEVVSLDAFRKK